MFFPMVKLAIHGYEILILSLASPIIMGSKLISMTVECGTGKFLIRLLVISSLLSFQFEEPLIRLLLLSFGTCVAMLDLCSSLSAKYYCYRSIVVWALICSLFFFLSARVYFNSLIPAWSGIFMNLGHFLVGFAVLFDQFIRDRTMWQLLPSFEYQTYNEIDPLMPTLGFSLFRVSPRDAIFQSNWLLIGIGFGSLLFNLNWVFGELSVVSRWASHDFPNQGLNPIPYGSLLVWIFLFCGVVTVKRLDIVTNRWWASVGLISYFVLYFGRGLLSFVGGLGLSLFIGSVIPLLFDKIARGLSARIIVVASIIYILQIIYAVWTSAYNFVPFGGTLTRETSYILVFLNFFGIYLGVYTAKHNLCTLVRGRLLSIELPNRYIWSDADVIGLLETDTAKPFFGNTDLTSYLSEKLHMFADFGPSSKDHTWGCIILSKYPIVKSKHYLLPSPEGELAPAIHATLQTATKMIDVVIVHMGNDRDDLDRRLQAQKLKDIMKSSNNPLIFLGYITSAPFNRDYTALTSAAKDIDSTDTDRWCEYILYKNLIRVAYARITHAGLTDTEIQVAKFKIPTSDTYEDNPIVTTDPSAIQNRSLLFNSKFGQFYRGHGHFNSHRFHMDTPKYFLPKDRASQCRENGTC
ncbi:unnamed protein product [Didymodactylos carnosus]|uniref:PGAP2-interacting protein n=1 Tax=Didymodactylos carnosus TaxID=1234261 RepID=A0A813XFQ9_9BILA|nr:unnamed protein product [Didymodactylos carnosus]CAF3656869.1 unnamed protein product [Didymodactylos carnosus]